MAARKYMVEEITKATNKEEYQRIKNYFSKSSYGNFNKICDVQEMKIYQVFEKNAKKRKVNPKKSTQQNMIAFHGTDEKGNDGILLSGYKNSSYGILGKAVYNTECAEVAYLYSVRSSVKAGKTAKIKSYIFINELEQNKKDCGETVEFSTYFREDTDGKINNPFTIYRHKNTSQLENYQYVKDKHGRKFRNVKIDTMVLETS